MNSLKKLLMATLFMTNIAIYAEEPYASIHNIPATPYYVQDAYVYYELINSHQAAIIIDVESQDGAVARFIAQQANNLPSLSKIYSIKAWTECSENKHAYQRFLSNVKQENTTNLIIPIRMSSQEAALALNVSADFISLVGKNDAEVIYKDILAWYHHLSDNGVICGNNWYDHSVQLGVTKAATSLDQILKINNNVWYFEKNAP